MKKIICALLALTLLMGLSGCGLKYIGEYESQDLSVWHTLQYPGWTGPETNLLNYTGIKNYSEKIKIFDEKSQLYEHGKYTLILEAGGTGSISFTTNDSDNTKYYGSGFMLLSGNITWEETDGYLYLNGTLDYHDESGETEILQDVRFTLEGKTLKCSDGTNLGCFSQEDRFTKQ